MADDPGQSKAHTDAEKDGLRAEIARLRAEGERQRNEIQDLNALIAAYRKWAAQCPITETKARS